MKRGRAAVGSGSANKPYLERDERDEEARQGQRGVRLLEHLDRHAALGVHRLHDVRVVALLGAHD